MINSRPLTYINDDAEGISYALCPSELVNGRRISTTPNEAHFEVVSTHETLPRRMKHHRMLLRQFTKRWRSEYLLSLREKHLIKSKPQGNQEIKVGDVVILRNDTTKRAFWKLAIVESLLSSKDGITRAAIVKIANTDNSSRCQCLKRSIKHLHPIEVNTSQAEPVIADDVQNTEDLHDRSKEPSNATVMRPRRSAAATGDLIRRIHQTSSN